MAYLLVKVKINSLVEGGTLRVLAVTPSYPRFQGDYHGRFIQDMYTRLSGYVDIQVLAPRSRSSQRTNGVLRFPYMPTQRLELIAERTMKDAPLSHISQLPLYMTSAYIHMSQIEADIVHAHWATPMGYLASINQTPYILTCHGSDCSLPLSNPLFRPFTRRALGKASKIVAVSEYVKQLAMKLGAPREKVTVNYLGVDTQKFTPPNNQLKLREAFDIPSGGTVIGSLGRLVRSKRVHDLLRAADMNREKLDAFIVIGGDGPEYHSLKEMAKRMELDNVYFTGFVEDPVSFHQMCDVYVLSSEREGLSTSLQEAMACGCTPVAVNGVGCPEVVSDGINGFLYDTGNVEELAKCILKASEQGFSGKARETIIEKFNLDVNALKYLEIYSEILEK